MDQSDKLTQAGRLIREAYFQTFVYYRDLPDAKAINETVRRHIYAWRSEDQKGIVRSNVKRVGSWHSVLDMHQRKEYLALAQEIVATAEVFFRDLGYDPDFEPKLDTMWANINPRHGYNRAHVHPNVLWSGVYYVQAPADSGRILFRDPRPQVETLTPRYARDQPRRRELWSEVYYPPIEGRMILFPAWLLHEVEPNLSENKGPAGDRISVSFNLCQTRRDRK